MQPAAISIPAAPGCPDDVSLASYDYELPDTAIAQRPAPQRDAARLMVVDPLTGGLAHTRFAHLGAFLRPGDVLVLNDSRVNHARLRGRKASGGVVDALLLEREDVRHWTALVRASRRPRPGTPVHFGADLQATVVADLGNGQARLCFPAGEDVDVLLERTGEVPLPPYIRRPGGPDAEDRERYQTVYARVPGSVAAPTAGLHFTPELLAGLVAEGIAVATVTLHVGAATFQPIRTDDVSQHELEGERYAIPQETVTTMAAARARGGRIVAVGTTTTRALEASAASPAGIHAGEGRATLFIRPGHRFRAIDGLITNFHLPRSSLLVLVTAFLGRARVRTAYAEALASGYRFYSYGDAMLALCRQGRSGSP